MPVANRERARAFAKNPWVFLAAGIILLLATGTSWMQALDSKDWQQAQATIGRSSRRGIFYVYDVNGQNYEGRKVVLAPARLRLIEPRIRRDRNTVTVYYDPQRPQRSAMNAGVSFSLVVQTVSAAAVLFYGLALLAKSRRR